MAKLCVALDTDIDKATGLAQSIKGENVILKVGQKLFIQGGREFIKDIKAEGFEVFLDLKLHDIPNTVKLAVEEIEKLGVDYITLHSLGGKEMLKAASEVKGKLKLIGVTILTSLSEEFLKFIRTEFKSLKDMVLYLAKVCEECGIDGVVCSGGEVKEIKERTKLFTVVPGVRIKTNPHDQKRVYTLEEVLKSGADIIVMGREIYASENPEGKVKKILEIIKNYEKSV